MHSLRAVYQPPLTCRLSVPVRKLAQETRHVAPFVKLAYPDLVGAVSSGESEPLGNCDRMVCR